MSFSSNLAFNFEEAHEVACRCRKGEGPSDVIVLAQAVQTLHASVGCGPELLAVIGRLYTVVAEHAALGPRSHESCLSGGQDDRP